MSNEAGLSSKAVLIRHSIRAWSAKAVDHEVTAKVGSDAGAQGEWGSVSKILVKSPALDEIKSITSKARSHHTANTLPWEDAGTRILPSKMYLDYMKEQGEFKMKYESAVEKFIAEYQDAIDNARIRLGSLFKAADYPSEQKLRRRFEFSLAVSNVPDSRDFRVNLANSEVEKIKAEVEARMRNVMMDATSDLFNRVHEAVSHMVEMLGDPERRIHKSLIENMAALVQVLPKLNIEDDPDLDRIITEVGDMLSGTDATTLKKDPDLRAQKAAEAQNILDSLGAYVQ